MTGAGPLDLTVVELVLEAIPDATALVDRAGSVLATNRRFEREVRTTGRDGDDLVSLADDPDDVTEALTRWFASTAPQPAPITVAGQRYRCDGARLGPHELAVIRFVGRTEAVEAFAATSRAVDLDRLERTKSRLRGALREVQAANAALRASNEELERFASIVSHDLQSPLLVIRGMASMLMDQLEDPEDRELADAVIRNAEKMQIQIRGILQVARAGTDAEPDELLPLGDAVTAVRELLASDLRGDGHVLTVVGELPEVPLTSTEAVQLLQNLIQNALKFADSGDGARIELSARRLDGMVEVSVEDDGPGVAENERDRVFDLFHRADESHDGTGIGLATCRRIVERRGGRIWIEDSDLGGAAVRFTLPSTGRDEEAL